MTSTHKRSAFLKPGLASLKRALSLVVYGYGAASAKISLLVSARPAITNVTETANSISRPSPASFGLITLVTGSKWASVSYLLTAHSDGQTPLDALMGASTPRFPLWAGVARRTGVKVNAQANAASGAIQEISPKDSGGLTRFGGVKRVDYSNKT